MKREDLGELHYITPVANVPSIRSLGLLSHRRVAKLKHRSVAMLVIQERRQDKRLPDGRRLHDCVNLYVFARNSTLYHMTVNNADVPLCVLRVTPDVLDLPGVMITDRNAASDWARFSPSSDGLEHLNKDVIFARYWTHADPVEQVRHKSAMCAEVLVPDRLDFTFVRGAYVPCVADRSALTEVAPELPAVINGDFFFNLRR